MKKRLFINTLAAAALAFSANVFAQQGAGEFFRAIKSDNATAMRELLAQGVDPNLRDERGRPGLYVALQDESLKAADALMTSPRIRLDDANANGETPLMMAALKGQTDVARRLIRQGAAVNKSGWTPLHYAASGGHLPVMQLLLDEHRARIDAPSPNGTTPLMMAAGYGSPEAVRYLLSRGANAQLRNQKGMTALDFARRYERPDARAILEKVKQSTPPAQRGKW